VLKGDVEIELTNAYPRQVLANWTHYTMTFRCSNGCQLETACLAVA